MAQTFTAPTRMALSQTKKKLATAQRGHKLLKDKRDELMWRFLSLVQENRQLRRQVEQTLTTAYGQLALARAVLGRAGWRAALAWPGTPVEIMLQTQNAMGVTLPVLTVFAELPRFSGGADCQDLADGMETLRGAVPLIVKLAQIEQNCRRLSAELEKTRRRVNALEYVLIPQYQQTRRHIAMRLEENDRATNTRLRKVKDLVLERARPQS